MGQNVMTSGAAGQEVEDHSKAKVFISYSRKDMAFVDRLEAALKARGFESLIDRTEIYAFEDWWQRIEGLIGRADTVVFVLSPDAVASTVSLKEIAYAASLNKRFAPIVCRRVADAATPEAVRRLNYVFFDDPSRFEASADQLELEVGRTDYAFGRRQRWPGVKDARVADIFISWTRMSIRSRSISVSLSDTTSEARRPVA